ncbi:MAG TPA: ATP-binding protein, partial [Clostridia bacterium]|nr:ATP-binding protein [Clostridia bacterium]
MVDAEITLPISGRKVLVKKYGCFCYQSNEIERCLGQEGIARNKDIFEMSGIGKRFKNCSFENFKPYIEVKQAFETVAEYTEKFEFYKEAGIGLILKGGPGCGKSHLAAALCQELIFKGYIVKFALVPIILDDMRKSYGKKPTEGEQDILKQMAEVELLVLDDMGAEKSTPWVIEQMFILINR